MRQPQLPMDGKRTAGPNPALTGDPHQLLRLLIASHCPPGSCRTPSQDPQGADLDEIVLDIELDDGYRYLLVRTLKPSRAAVELSPREKEIVRMVAQGHPNKIIADVLNISCWTVCTHLRRVFAKLGVGSRAAMVARLHELGSTRLGTPKAVSAEVAARRTEAHRDETSKAAGIPPKLQDLRSTRRQTA